jgi:hypothetical protein
LPIVEEELRRVQLELSSSKNSTLGGASEDVEKLQRELITLRQGVRWRDLWPLPRPWRCASTPCVCSRVFSRSCVQLEHSQRRERGLADEVQRIRSQRKNAEVLDSQVCLPAIFLPCSRWCHDPVSVELRACVCVCVCVCMAVV